MSLASTDPTALLEGTGVTMRHAKIRSPDEARQAVVRLLKQAAAAERRSVADDLLEDRMRFWRAVWKPDCISSWVTSSATWWWVRSSVWRARGCSLSEGTWS